MCKDVGKGICSLQGKEKMTEYFEDHDEVSGNTESQGIRPKFSLADLNHVETSRTCLLATFFHRPFSLLGGTAGAGGCDSIPVPVVPKG